MSNKYIFYLYYSFLQILLPCEDANLRADVT